MPLWAKIDVEMPTDAKLLAQPLATRHLWTCLICLAKQQDQGGRIEGFTGALLAGRFNIPKASVDAGLRHFRALLMAEVDEEGTILLLNFEKRQGPEDTANARSARYYDRHRETIREKRKVSRAPSHGVPTAVLTPESHAVSRQTVSLEVELEKEKEEEIRDRSAELTTPRAPGVEDWDPALLQAVREALKLTDLDHGWGQFVGQSLREPAEKRHAAAREFLHRRCAQQGKDWPYLLGMIRNGAGIRTQPAKVLQAEPVSAERRAQVDHELAEIRRSQG